MDSCTNPVTADSNGLTICTNLKRRRSRALKNSINTGDINHSVGNFKYEFLTKTRISPIICMSHYYDFIPATIIPM
jgi:hypothetical protein